MANIETVSYVGGGTGPYWIDMGSWDFRSISAQWNVHVLQQSGTETDFISNFDPYALASLHYPSFNSFSIVGTGFWPLDTAGFPTQGQVSEIVLKSSFDNLYLDFKGIAVPAASLLSAIRDGRTSDAVALLTSGDDVIQGAPANISPTNGGGGDVIYGGAGDDTIIGHGGSDILHGGDGNDFFSTVDHTTADTAIAAHALIDGGAGINTVSYADAPYAIQADLSGATNSTDSLLDVQHVVGSRFADVLTGSDGPDTLESGGGNDTIKGGDGGDRIVSGYDFSIINGNRGDDTIVGQSAHGDWLLGGQGNDFLDATGSGGHNIINGNLGDDTIYGGAAGDMVRGGQGNDSVWGGSGPSWISGDLGDNTLTGGTAADTFHAGAGHDIVLNFNAGGGTSDRVQVDPGIRYAVAQVGPDVVLTFDNGGHMVLQQVQLNTLPPGWLVG